MRIPFEKIGERTGVKRILLPFTLGLVMLLAVIALSSM